MADQHGAYDSSLQPRREGFCEWCCGLPWPEILRVYGFVLGAALVVVGIVSYAKLGDFSTLAGRLRLFVTASCRCERGDQLRM